jgi:hypothetical protein
LRRDRESREVSLVGEELLRVGREEEMALEGERDAGKARRRA